jgi:hypothetical protein
MRAKMMPQTKPTYPQRQQQFKMSLRGTEKQEKLLARLQRKYRKALAVREISLNATVWKAIEEATRKDEQ